MAKGTRKKYSRAQTRARIRKHRRRSGSLGWYVVIAAVVGLGTVGIVFAKGNNDAQANVPPIVNQDHWHSYFGVDLCGTWLNHTPQSSTDPGLGAPPFESNNGIHSHGDGLIHMHPYSSIAAGTRATVGRFLADNAGAGWSLSSDSIKLWDGAEHKSGQTCTTGPMKGKPAYVVWSVGHYHKAWTGKLRSGDPSAFRPQNGDIIAIGFLPKGEKLPEPPDAEAALTNISDLGGSTASTTPAVPGVPGNSSPAPSSSSPPASTSSSTP